jgi:hypothetical protein
VSGILCVGAVQQEEGRDPDDAERERLTHWRQSPKRSSIHFVRADARSDDELDAAVRRFRNAIIVRALIGELTRPS